MRVLVSWNKSGKDQSKNNLATDTTKTRHDQDDTKGDYDDDCDSSKDDHTDDDDDDNDDDDDDDDYERTRQQWKQNEKMRKQKGREIKEEQRRHSKQRNFIIKRGATKKNVECRLKLLDWIRCEAVKRHMHSFLNKSKRCYQNLLQRTILAQHATLVVAPPPRNPV